MPSRLLRQTLSAASSASRNVLDTGVYPRRDNINYHIQLRSNYVASKSKMISRRQGGGDEAYFVYVEEADDEVNKDSALI